MLKSILKLRIPLCIIPKNNILAQNENIIRSYQQRSIFLWCKSLQNSKETNLTSNNEAESSTIKQKQSSNVNRDKMIKILQLEVDVARQEGRRVPDPAFIKDKQWEYLLTLKTRTARTKYYAYLWQLEKKIENQVVKKQKKSEEIEMRRAREKQDFEESNHIIYGINHTSMFLRIYDTTINHWHNNKLTRAMQFGQKIVLDCGYDINMTKRESENTAKQLMLCFADNRYHNEPFDLHYCNTNFNETAMKALEKFIPTLRDPSFPVHVHEKCFTEVFPKNKIVYLTPHCKNDLNTYDPDDIYIIGAIVDKINNEPVSLAKAKKLGLRMARLPLDQYLSWGSGSGKSLTLNQMINVMLDIKSTGDWNFSLRHVPRRKILHEEQEIISDKKREEKTKIRAKKFEFDINSWGRPKNRFRN